MDGEYHAIDSRREYIDVPWPVPVRLVTEPLTEVTVPLNVVRYTLRQFETHGGTIWFFADSEMSDIFVIEHLLYHYPRPS